MKKLLVLALALALLLSLSACGDDSDRRALYIYNFGDYLDTDLFEVFEEEYDCRIIQDTFDTNEEMYPVLKKGTISYDLICVSDYMIEKLDSEGMLAEIDLANVPNVENVADYVRPFWDTFDPGMKKSVPHAFGLYVILYNPTMIEGEPSSWADLWKPQYKGEIIMPNSIREAYMITAKMLGYDINTVNEAEIAEMTDFLIDQKELVYRYDNDGVRDYLIGESAAIGVITSGEYEYSIEYNEDLVYSLPEEGTEVWTDCWAIPKNARNKDLAEAFINFMLSEEAAAANYEYLTYTIPNDTISDLMEDEIHHVSAEYLAKCDVMKNLGEEADRLYSEYWKKVKSK